jgi:hypothetical protein
MENLFDKYIKKEIFSNILSFLPKKYVISNRIICKKWKQILTSKFIKKTLDPFTEPYCMYYLKNFDYKGTGYFIEKINGELCCRDFFSDYIGILDDNGIMIEKKYNIDRYVVDVVGESTLVWFTFPNLIINNSEEKIIIDREKFGFAWKIAMEKNYIYVLGDENIFQFNIRGEYIKKWPIGYCMSDDVESEMVASNGKIFLSSSIKDYISVYSNGKLIKKIDGFNYKSSRFNIYGDFIYVMNFHNYLIRILTKKGKEIGKKITKSKIAKICL